MKKLLLAITIPVFFVLGTPALLATIMYDGSGDSHMPVDLYTEDADFEKMLYEELSVSLDDVENGITTDMVYNLDQDILNTAIFQVVRENINENYLPGEDCDTPECAYIIYEPIPVGDMNLEVKLVGIWLEFEDMGTQSNNQGRAILNVFLEVTLDDGFTYKTIVGTHFILQDDTENGEYYFEFDKVKIGNLPIPKAMITSILDAVGVDIETEIQETLKFGTFSGKDISYTVGKQELVDQMGSDDEELDANGKLAQEMMSVVLENYVSFDVNDEDVALTIAVSLLRNDDDQYSDIPAYLYDLHDYDPVTDTYGEYNPDLFNPEQYLEDKFTEFVFNRALSADTNFYLKERTFNKLIYHGAEGFADMGTDYTFTNSDGEEETIEIGLRAIWFEFEEGTTGEGQILAKALFQVSGINSLLEIKALNTSETVDTLEFDFNSITIGKDPGELDGDYTIFENIDIFKEVFAEMGDVEFGEFNADGKLVISAAKLSGMMQDGSSDGAVVVDGIGVVENAITLSVVPANEQLEQILNDFTSALNDIVENGTLLTELENNPAFDASDPESPEAQILEDVEAMQNQLAGGDTDVDPEQISDMFETFETLDPAAQETFLDTFEGAIPPETYAQFSDYFQSGETPPTP